MHKLSLFLLLAGSVIACQSAENKTESEPLKIYAADYTAASFEVNSSEAGLILQPGEWLEYEIEVPQGGRYRISLAAQTASAAALWIEDYVHNPDNRSYNITGSLPLSHSDTLVSIDGSPLAAGTHPVRVHAEGGAVELNHFHLELMQAAFDGSEVLLQEMHGQGDWQLVWSDEFEEGRVPDTTKWNYNVGNWGWGNNELQYYTDHDSANAYLENGHLVIKAIKDKEGSGWTSARLTTQGNQAFQYGRVEFRARVPEGRGTWSAGWLLGDDYRDEKSWPYCGEIDVLECVGYEIDDSTGDGVNHASCHTPAYYFKKDNHITGQIAMENMVEEYHTYGIEWYPDSVRAYVDGEFYYLYDKTANELEWPFDKPQAIILNLAVGGGWGGTRGVDETWNQHEYLIDYVRVYGK